MSDSSFPNITWTQFELCNDNRTEAFEDMCWELFHMENLKESNVPHADHNNSGVEVQPILEPLHEDGSPRRRVSFQAKYFTKEIQYSQIRHSLETIVKHYEGKLDHIFLFCNLTLTTTSKTYKEMEKIVADAGMTLQAISNKDILNLIKKNRPIAEYYFLQRRIHDINIYSALMDKFIRQYHDHPSIKMTTPDYRLLPKGVPVIDSFHRTAKEGKHEPASIRELLLESWHGQEQKHILFVGEGGIGKTVTMLTLSNEEWFKDFKIPVIYIPLQMMINYHGELNKYINENYRNEIKGINELSNTLWTGHPNLLLLLDGFNEIPMKYKQIAENHIVEWMNKPGVQIITTSRINSFLSSRFLEYTLQPLPYETSREYLITAGITEKDLPPKNDDFWNVINIPLMLILFTKINTVKGQVLESKVSKYLDWKEPDSAVHIIWNYLQVELYKLINIDGSSVVLSSVAILAIAPFVCYKMAKEGKFFVEQEEFQRLIRTATDYFAQNQTLLPSQIITISNFFDETGKEKPLDDCKWTEYFNLLSKQAVLFIKKVNKDANGQERIVYVLAHQNFRDVLAAIFVSGCLLNRSIKKEELVFPKEELINTDFFIRNYISELLTDDELIMIWDYHRFIEPENGRVTWILMDIIGRKRKYDYSQLDFSGLDLTKINLYRLLSKRNDICPLPNQADLLNKTKIAFENIIPEYRESDVTDLEFSPSGRYLARSLSIGEVRIWDLESGVSRMLETRLKNIIRIVFSPDGRSLTCFSFYGRVCILNLESGEGRILEPRIKTITKVLCSSDGSSLACILIDHRVCIWNLKSGEKRILEGYIKNDGVRYSPDGSSLACILIDGRVCIWDLESGERRIVEPYLKEIIDVRFSPDGRTLVGESIGGNLCIWNLENREICVINYLKNDFTSKSYSPDGKYLATCTMRGIVRILDLEKKRSRLLQSHLEGVTSVLYSPDGRHLIGASFLGIVIWDLESGESRVFKQRAEHIVKVLCSSNGRYFAEASFSTIYIWDLESGECRTLESLNFPLKGNLTSVSYSQNGRYFASGVIDNLVRIWDLESGEGRILNGNTDIVTSVSYSPDGRHLASGSDNNTICIWDLESGENRILGSYLEGATIVWYSSDERYLVGVSFDHRVYIWDLESGECHKQECYIDDLRNVSYSADRNLLAWSSYGGPNSSNIHIRNLESGESRILQADRVSSMLLSPDGKHIASDSYDRKVNICDLESGENRKLDVISEIYLFRILKSSKGALLVISLGVILGIIFETRLLIMLGLILGILFVGAYVTIKDGKRARITCMAYSADGNNFACAMDNGTVQIWDLKSSKLRVLIINTGIISNMSYSPDGRLLTGVEGDILTTWDTVTGRVINYYRIISNVNLFGANFEKAIVSKTDRVILRETGAKA